MFDAGGVAPAPDQERGVDDEAVLPGQPGGEARLPEEWNLRYQETQVVPGLWLASFHRPFA